MNYNISFPGHCGCNRNQGVYGTNMWNPNHMYPNNSQSCGHQQACNDCLDIIKDLCVFYMGSNLTNTGINNNDNLRTVLQKLDALFEIQADKNDNILEALNDINDRVNALETDAGIPGGGVHPPYTLL